MKRCFTKQYSNLKSFCFTSFSLYLLVCGVHAFANMNQWCLHVKGLHIVFILNDQEALVWRAEAHLIAERWDDAVRDMQRAVELNQNDQAAQVPTLAYASHSGICLTHSGICLTHSGICLTLWHMPHPLWHMSYPLWHMPHPLWYMPHRERNTEHATFTCIRYVLH